LIALALGALAVLFAAWGMLLLAGAKRRDEAARRALPSDEEDE